MELTPVKWNTPIRYDRNIKKRKDDLRDRNENRFCTVYACVVCTEVEFLNSEELSPIKSSQLPAQFPAAPAGEELTLQYLTLQRHEWFKNLASGKSATHISLEAERKHIVHI